MDDGKTAGYSTIFAKRERERKKTLGFANVYRLFAEISRDLGGKNKDGKGWGRRDRFSFIFPGVSFIDQFRGSMRS